MRTICLIALGLLLAWPAAAADPVQTAQVQAEAWPDDRSMGAADAPVTMIEYASLTCPHCASFHNETLPKLKQAYIDTGKVRFVYRDFPIDGLALRAAMLARCVEPERYFGLLEVLFSGQEGWSRAKDPIAALRRIGRLAGLGPEKSDACMADKEIGDDILGARLKASQRHDVNSTPTFIIGDRKISGARSYEEFDGILRALVPDS